MFTLLCRHRRSAVRNICFCGFLRTAYGADLLFFKPAAAFLGKLRFLSNSVRNNRFIVYGMSIYSVFLNDNFQGKSPLSRPLICHSFCHTHKGFGTQLRTFGLTFSADFHRPANTLYLAALGNILAVRSRAGQLVCRL